ncbi:MAG: hypothetical protein K2L51_00300 [Clostridiales bacterium]|nr:hypothetical protein [Clostridiales bacterium]
MTLSDIEIYAQNQAILSYVNECLGTTFALRQLRGVDFSRMELRNAAGVVLLAPLEVIDKVCVGMLAVAKEINKEV